MEYKCRLCLTESFVDNCMNNIFQSKLRYSEATIVDNLYWIFSIEVDASDRYTKQICHDCLSFLENILKCRQVFQNNQRLLKYQSLETELTENDLEIEENSKDGTKKGNRIPCSTGISNLGNSILPFENHFMSPIESSNDLRHPPRLSAFDECDFGFEKELLDVSETCKEGKDFNSVDAIEDWTKKTFKKDVSTCTEKISILPKNSVSLSYDVLKVMGPKVRLEPLATVVKRENFRQISNKTFKKLDDEICSHSDDSERQYKWDRYIDYYYSMKTSSIRELILGKSNVKVTNLGNEIASSLYSVSNSYVFVCDLCSAVFKSKIWLRNHYKKKHKQLPHWSIDYDEQALREVIGGCPY